MTKLVAFSTENGFLKLWIIFEWGKTHVASMPTHIHAGKS